MYFTSDLHLGHKKVLQDRGFHGDIQLHDDYIINQLKSINPKSTIWILGDIACGKEDYALERLSEVKATMHLVSGNHDSVWPGHTGAYKKHKRFLEVFDTIQSHARIKLAGHKIELNHYPRDTEGEYRLHGHIHTYKDPNPWNIHIGLDAWSMNLVSDSDINLLISELDSHRPSW